jgi:hypothetical protein
LFVDSVAVVTSGGGSTVVFGDGVVSGGGGVVVFGDGGVVVSGGGGVVVSDGLMMVSGWHMDLLPMNITSATCIQLKPGKERIADELLG